MYCPKCGGPEDNNKYKPSSLHPLDKARTVRGPTKKGMEPPPLG